MQSRTHMEYYFFKKIFFILKNKVHLYKTKKKLQMNQNNVLKNQTQTKQLKKTYIIKRHVKPKIQVMRPR